ncbi:hypothetical protein V8C35DRAFT_298350 [Trichoderma chlorosporum]
MSGFDIVGIVLGAIPLVISALEHYKDGISIIRRMKKYEHVYTHLHLSFSLSLALYRESCTCLLQQLELGHQQEKDLVYTPKREQWAAPQLQTALEKRLGENHELYLSAVRSLNRRILSFSKKLRLRDDFKPQWIEPDGTVNEKARKKFFRNLWVRIIGGFSVDDYKTLLDDMDKDIDKMSRLTPKAAQKPIPAETVTVQSVTAETKNKLQVTHWKDIRDSADRLFLTLSSRFHPCSYHLLHKVNLRLDIQNCEDVTNNVRFTLHVMLEASGGKSKSYSGDWREIEIEASQITDTSSPPLILDGRGKKTVTFFTASSAVSQLAQTASYPIFTKIDDFCDVLMSDNESKKCLGVLEDRSWQHHVYSARHHEPASQLFDATSLKEELDSISTREKCIIAFTLATAVLQLHNTPWLPQNWDLEDIFVIKGRACSSWLSRSFVSQTFNYATSSSATKPPGPLVKNKEIFALGVVLLELSYGRPLLSLQAPEDLDGQGRANPSTIFLKVTRLARDIIGRETKNYANVVSRCVNCMFETPTYDFENQAFRRSFLKKR